MFLFCLTGQRGIVDECWFCHEVVSWSLWWDTNSNIFIENLLQGAGGTAYSVIYSFQSCSEFPHYLTGKVTGHLSLESLRMFLLRWFLHRCFCFSASLLFLEGQKTVWVSVQQYSTYNRIKEVLLI